MPNAHASSSRETKKHKSAHRSKHRHDKSDKDKKTHKSAPFEHRLSRMRLSVPPKYAADWLTGVREVLNEMLMRYVPQMEGVLLAHWEHEFLDDTVKIIDECPYGVCEVQFRSVVWAPKIGQRLYGTHSLSSPSHLSLLFARTFNISIPLQHIPQDLYKFEHADLEDLEEDSADSDDGVEEVGRWRNVETNLLVGEEGKKGIKFTVIGMQVNNQVLSLTGSLLEDPHNPPPPPAVVAPTRIESPSPEPTEQPKQSQKPQRLIESSESVPAVEDAIDERFLSARELKKKRKDDEKAKRDARKARKEGQELEAVGQMGAEAMVGISGDRGVSQGKRKAKEEEGGRKKRKE